MVGVIFLAFGDFGYGYVKSSNGVFLMTKLFKEL